MQFLAEAAILTVIERVIGIILGIIGHMESAGHKYKYADDDQPRNQSQYDSVCNSVFLCSRRFLWNIPCEKGREAQSY